MDASSLQHQEMYNQSMDNVLVCSKAQQERKPKPQQEQAIPCPRCESTNTKFCYYNNYSLSQPRYFCKGCRRYWTQGGTLRNVPVGGGCRRNKRSSSSTSSTKRIQDQSLNFPSGYQNLSYDSNDLSLAYARLHQKQGGGHSGYADNDISMFGNQNNAQCEVLGDVHTSSARHSSFLEALRSGFFHNQNGYHNIHNYGHMGEVENSGVNMGVSGEMVIPYEDVSTIATTNAVTVTTTKQEMCNFARENDNKMLWGLPWHLNGDGNMGGDLASSWHGLVNAAPLI